MGSIRLATPADAEGILAIYAPVVRETAISFELEPPAVAEMRDRIAATGAILPWLVFESAAGVIGYAYASRHRERPAYRWSVDVSVYVGAAARGRGVARQLYTVLFGLLEDLSYYTAFAGIALPNEASVGFHEAMGFEAIGIYRKVGYKFGAWHNVGWWQRVIQAYIDDPRDPVAMRDYVGSQALADRLSRGMPFDEP